MLLVLAQLDILSAPRVHDYSSSNDDRRIGSRIRMGQGAKGSLIEKQKEQR